LSRSPRRNRVCPFAGREHESPGRRLSDRGFRRGAVSGSSLLREHNVAYALPFTPVPDCLGLLGLGPKLIGEPYTEEDRELLGTLVNNLVVALKNARSFEEIRRLNEDLQAKNIELEKALDELRAAMRKVEILESVKASLSKFVPPPSSGSSRSRRPPPCPRAGSGMSRFSSSISRATPGSARASGGKRSTRSWKSTSRCHGCDLR